MSLLSMPRTARRAPGGMVFHVLNRGVGCRTVFHKDEDFAPFGFPNRVCPRGDPFAPPPLLRPLPMEPHTTAPTDTSHVFSHSDLPDCLCLRVIANAATAITTAIDAGSGTGAAADVVSTDFP